ncbi:3-oxoadipate enol-lactonase [Primorskyibacter flagellatus]|uniref:3-oxoadipate enol-lactonase n=1 Tax=Primorskyibacter flagellatus TaxID=1387277 RepID=A0A1W2DIY7_9RHOB|nr:3-oxoadipate enol-lactonase [Primorskyibacter flagellatus]SMC97062.1 3-oxoadipate enol-lactonase [Primorskyibacter flagellatus]
MKIATLGEIGLHYRIDGNPDGAPVVFANSLGTDLRLWDQVIPLLPKGLKYIRYDKRGHGLSSCPPAPYSMGALITDAERLLDHLGVRDCVFVGLSIGGMIAQGLAAKRLDLVRALVLSNTGAKIGTKDMWEDRVATLRKGGIAALSDAILERWFSEGFRQTDAFLGWENMLLRQPLEGYIGCSQAISGTDFYTPTAALTLPALGIAGSVDGSTPPDLVRETIDLIKGSDFRLIKGAGHLPCVEKPEEYAAILTDFLTAQGHV